MRVSFYVRNKNLSPSGYYRLIQYVPKLDCESIVHSIVPDKMFSKSLQIKRYPIINKLWSIVYYIYVCFKTLKAFREDKKRDVDCVVVSKAFFPRICPGVLVKYMDKFFSDRKLIWDCDDAIVGNTLSLNEYNCILKNSYRIVMTHNGLKNSLPEEFREKVVILPTTDGDMQGFVLEDIIRSRKEEYDAKIKLLWLATAVNIPNLRVALEGLDAAAKTLTERGKKLVLHVVCNLPIEDQTQYLEIKNIQWSHQIAIQELFQCHIGIMPLQDNEFNKGKGAFKIVQYMSTGMPVIATEVGFNAVVVQSNYGYLVSSQNKSEEWKRTVEDLALDEKKWEAFSQEAYAEWLKNFSFERNLAVWQQILDA